MLSALFHRCSSAETMSDRRKAQRARTVHRRRRACRDVPSALHCEFDGLSACIAPRCDLIWGNRFRRFYPVLSSKIAVTPVRYPGIARILASDGERLRTLFFPLNQCVNAHFWSFYEVIKEGQCSRGAESTRGTPL